MLTALALLASLQTCDAQQFHKYAWDYHRTQAQKEFCQGYVDAEIARDNIIDDERGDGSDSFDLSNTGIAPHKLVTRSNPFN